MLKLLSILYNMLIVMSIAEELEAVERERARRRQAHGRTAPGKNASGNISGSDKGETRDKVAAAVGLGSGRTYDKAAESISGGRAQLLPNVWQKLGPFGAQPQLKEKFPEAEVAERLFCCLFE